MNYFDDPMFLRQVIMDHYEYPRNYKDVKEVEYETIRMKSDTCIDDLTFFFKVKNDVIQEIFFYGKACTIATASASIMTEYLKGKTFQEASTLWVEFMKMMKLEEYDQELLKEANAFKNVGYQANRINCASLSWNALYKLIEEVTNE